jgi:ATP-dependent DNA helicase DinG
VEFVVFDLETTGLSAINDEIIEIGAVHYLDGKVVDTFQSFIRPVHAIPAYIQSLTGIGPQDVENAPVMEEVLPRFLSFIAGKSLAGHNVQFDLDFLLKACEDNGYDLPTSDDAIDSLLLARVLLPMMRGYSLENLANYFHIEESSFHRAQSDAATTAKILDKLMDEAVSYPHISLVELARLASMFSQRTSEWFTHAAEKRYEDYGNQLPPGCDVILHLAFHHGQADDGQQRNAVQSDFMKETSQSSLSGQSLECLTSSQGLPRIFPGFEIREGQRQMTEAVANALSEEGHLIVEAGTGTGKSLAYLIPSAIYAVQNDSRVVVSTHTIALQDQIEKRDFPTLRALLGDSVSLALLKGRSHYICLRKLYTELQSVNSGMSQDELVAYMILVCWLVKTSTGMKEELALNGKMKDVWLRVQSDSETCLGKHCPFFKSCFYFQARAKAYDADVIVTNHSLVLSDLKADHNVLPKYSKLILDEAHHLEDEATKHLGKEAYLGQCLNLISRLSRDNDRHGLIPDALRAFMGDTSIPVRLMDTLRALQEILPEVRAQIEGAFHVLGELCSPSQGEQRITDDTYKLPAWETFATYLDNLKAQTPHLTKASTQFGEFGENEEDTTKSGRFMDISGYINQLLEQTQVLHETKEPVDNFVAWVEHMQNGSRKQISVHYAPVDVARILERDLFGKKETVVLTSATLSVNGRFDYVINQLGLRESSNKDSLSTLTVTSPFELAEQAMLCVPTDVPELAKLNSESAAAWLCDSLYQLAKICKGRMLVLFTSHAMLRATAEQLRGPLESLQLKLFAQGVDGSRTHLLRAFKNEPDSVLFGAQSFWEGIDLPGDELTTLVIVRLPFTPPNHPVTEARHERFKRAGRNPFMEQSLPEAVVRFRQGFGRLIRTSHDRGVVVVYDKRLITARYGGTFVRSLCGVKPVVGQEKEILQKIHGFLNPSAQSGGEAET